MIKLGTWLKMGLWVNWGVGSFGQPRASTKCASRLRHAESRCYLRSACKNPPQKRACWETSPTLHTSFSQHRTRNMGSYPVVPQQNNTKKVAVPFRHPQKRSSIDHFSWPLGLDRLGRRNVGKESPHFCGLEAVCSLFCSLPASGKCSPDDQTRQKGEWQVLLSLCVHIYIYIYMVPPPSWTLVWCG